MSTPDFGRYRDPTAVGSVDGVITGYLGEGGRLLWVALVGMVVFEHAVVVTSGGPSPWWWAVVAVVAVTAALAVRRERPHVALAVTGLLVGVRTLWSSAHEVPFPISYVAVLVVMSWLAGRRTSGTRPFVLLVVGVNLVLLVVGLVLRNDTGIAEVGLNWLFSLLSCLVVVVLPWLLGRHRQQRTQLATAGWERAERMEHEQQLLVEQTRLRERSLIAGDMHDSLGHELSLIALRAGALEVAPDLADRHQRAAGEVRAAAATATERLAEIIGVLREDGAQAPLTPVGEGVAGLVERAAASGMAVRLTTTGDPTGTPAPVLRAVHRVVREGLTNATKHAPGAAVAVDVHTLCGETTVSVVNAAPPEAMARADAAGGQGIRGLRELIDLLGGSLRTGATEGGGFQIEATVPHELGPRRTGDGTEPEPVTTSADERDSVRRTARRGLLVAVVAPVVLSVSVALLILGYYVGISYASILDPEDYATLRAGDSRAGVEEVLPPLEMVDAPTERGAAPPPGASCEFYRPDGPFSISFAYRLCFEGDALVAKDVIPTGSVTPDEENP